MRPYWPLPELSYREGAAETGSGRAGCRGKSNRGRLPNIGKPAFRGHANLHALARSFFRHARKYLTGNLRQHGVGEDIVDVARSALDLGAAPGDFVEHGVVVAEGNPVSLLQAALDLADLELDDLLEGFVAHRVIGHDDHASEKGRLEDLVQLRLEGE